MPVSTTKQSLDETALVLLLVLMVVEDDGIEPTTPCLQSRCSPS